MQIKLTKKTALDEKFVHSLVEKTVELLGDAEAILTPSASYRPADTDIAVSHELMCIASTYTELLEAVSKKNNAEVTDLAFEAIKSSYRNANPTGNESDEDLGPRGPSREHDGT